MEEDQPGSAPDHTSLEDRIDDALAAHADGGPDALRRWLDEHPSSADAVREHVARLETLGLLDAAVQGVPTHPERLGGFRLVERIGEGGMGLVWIAEEEALGRRVALKMIRPEQLWFAGARERFRREVEAVARLQHPGIVPVYAAGEDGGVPFFTMELVDGCTLADVLRALREREPATLTGADLANALDEAASRSSARPLDEREEQRARGALFEGSWTDACLSIVRQVAEALDHAHGRGLVHRDVKPSNIALTRTGRALLFDFGLVRNDEAEHMTRTTTHPGSLPYMSPEQVSGEHELDERTDVYSLGVTLYELLTLKQPFSGGTVANVVERVLAGRRPSIRRENPRVSWEAETVCLGALETERTRRYPTANDFARDLTNVLERRPIAARRSGALRRAWRWSERNPGAAAALALGFLLFAVAPAAWALRERATGRRILAQSEEIRDANEALETSLAQTRREFERAEANYEDALGAVDRMLTRLADQRLAHVPHVEELRRELYEDALAFYERFAERRAGDPALRRELARAQIRMTSLMMFLGRNAELEALLAQGLGLLEECLAETPEDGELRRELAHALTSSSAVYGNLGRFADLERAAERSLAIFRDLAAQEPDDLELCRGVAAALKSLAIARVRTGRFDEAHELLGEALERLQGDAAERDPDVAVLLMTVSKDLGGVLVELGLPQDAEALLLDTLEVAEQWSSGAPDNPIFELFRGELLHALARAALARGEPEQALELWTRQLASAEGLVRDFPGTHAYQDDRVSALVNRGMALDRLGRYAEAETVFRRASDLAREIVTSLPESPLHHRVFAVTCIDLTQVLMRQDRFAEALDVLDEAVPLADAYAAEHRDDHEGRRLAMQVRVLGAETLIGLSQHAQAVLELRDLREHEVPAFMRFNATILFGRCIRLAGEDAELAPEQRADLAGEYEAETLDTLRWAVDGGFRDAQWLDEASVLDPLRSDPRFEEIVRPLRAAH